MVSLGEMFRGLLPRKASTETTQGSTTSGNHDGFSRLDEVLSVGSDTSVPAANACINLLASSLAKLPIGVIRQSPDGSWEPVPQHPLNLLFREPSNIWDAYSFWETAYRQLCARGNSYLLISRRGRTPVALEQAVAGEPREVPGRPTQGRPLPSRLVYDLTTGISFTKNATYGAGAVVALHGPGRFPGRLTSPSPVTAVAANAIKSIRSGSKFVNESLVNGITSSLIMQISQEALAAGNPRLQELTDEFDRQVHDMDRRGKAAFAPPGFTVASTGSLSALDLKILEVFRWSLEDIARAFGVPPRLIGYYQQGIRGENTTFERSLTDFYEHSLSRYSERIQSQLTRKLLSVDDRLAGLVVRFDTRTLASAPFSERIPLIGSAVSKDSLMTPNEGRKEIGLPPLPGYDELLTPKGAPTDAQEAPGGNPDDEDDDDDE